MGVIGKLPDAVRLGQLQALRIGDADRHCPHIGIDSVLIAADPVIGVRRHMEEMARRRRQCRQSIRIRLGPRGKAAHLGRMNIEMDRRRIIRMTLQHGFEQLDRTRQIIAILAQRRGDHPCVRSDRRDLVVVRPGTGEHVHRPGEGEIAVSGAAAMPIAKRQGSDHPPLLVGSGRGQPLGGIDLPGEPELGRRVDRIVDRGPRCPGFPPDAHRAERIELARLGKGGDPRLVREGVRELHPVVEKGLGCGLAGRDRKSAAAITLQDLGFARRNRVAAAQRHRGEGGRRRFLARDRRQQQEQRRDHQQTHGTPKVAIDSIVPNSTGPSTCERRRA